MIQLARTTRSLVRSSLLALPALPALLALIAGGACTDPNDFVVRARAELVPVGGSGIGGSVDIGHYEDSPASVAIREERIVLPDDEPRGIAIYDAADCNVAQAIARIFNPPSTAPVPPEKPAGDLGAIRKLDGEVFFYEARFFDPFEKTYGERYSHNSGLGSMSVEPGAQGSVIGKIVALRGPDSADGQPGAWQACAPFASTDLRR